MMETVAMPKVGMAEEQILPKEGMCDVDGDGDGTAKGRHVRCGRRRRRRQWKVWRRRWRCRWEACATETEALPKDGVTEIKKMPMDGVTEAKVKTKAEAETRPMEAHVTETVAMGDANGRRDGDEGDADGRRVRRRRRCQRWACATETKAETPMEA